MRNYDKANWVLGRVLADKADRIGDRVLVRTRETRVTYGEMHARSNRLAHGFYRLGLAQGDKACLMLDNHPEHFQCWFALGKIGAVDVPINTAYKGQILEYIIHHSEAKVLVVDEVYLERIRFIEKDLRNIRTVVIRRARGESRADVELGLETVDLEALFSNPDEPPRTSVHYSDLATIIYTSGTTGPSKGVMMSHAHCYFFAKEVAENLELRSTDMDYTCLPLFHANARLMCTYPCMLAEAQVAMAPRFSLSQFWEDIRYFGATVFNGLGAIGPLLLSTPPRPDDADNPVRLAFLVPPPKRHKEFEARFGLKVATTYGMTEITLPTFSPLGEEMPEGTCGKAIAGFDLRTVDEYDEALPDGQVGEMIVRHWEPYTMLSGYYNMPEKTLEACRNLWFHTGDAMYRDQNGWYYFVDRIKDSIRRRGENISSFEVESVIHSHPAVLECAVIAVKNPVLTEDEVMACIVLKPGEELTPEELIRFCEPRMPYFHVPRYVEMMEALPKTATDKIQKQKMRERGLTPQTWDREKAGIAIKR